MTVRAYPAYRESGVEWLGRVPAHWPAHRLGSYLAERREKVSDRDFTPLSVTKAGIVPQLDTAAKTDDGDNRKLVRKGDFAINGRSDRKGSSGLSSLDGSVSLINIVLSAVQPVDMCFVQYLLKSVLFQEEFYRFGKGIVADLWSTNYSEMRNIELAVPPSDEQSAIAVFLDRETRKIDTLVAEQERLIALLKEKRQAVISHAVTKGLNPNAPMKDSGMPWLGEIPKQWRVTRLKFTVGSSAIGIQTGPFGGMLTDLPSEPTGFKLYGQQNIISGDFDAGDRWISEHTFNSNSAYHINSGDLLVTRKGSLGNCRIVPDSVRPGWFDSDSIRIQVDHQILNSEYLQLALHEAPYVAKQIDETRRGAILSGINSEVIANLVLLLPCLDVQLQILSFLYEKRRKFDNLISEATRAIAILRERRAALIAAAVTGKIDVRDTVPSGQDAA